MQQFASGEKRKSRHDVGVASPQAPRFRAQPEQPLERVTLHPLGRLRFHSRQEIECRADANHDRSIKAVEMRRHPPLLLRRAQPDPDDVGRAALILSTTARSSSDVIARNGGQNVPTTCSPGTDRANVSFSFSATPTSPP
jgi:hypothetical protein